MARRLLPGSTGRIQFFRFKQESLSRMRYTETEDAEGFEFTVKNASGGEVFRYKFQTNVHPFVPVTITLPGGTNFALSTLQELLFYIECVAENGYSAVVGMKDNIPKLIKLSEDIEKTGLKFEVTHLQSNALSVPGILGFKISNGSSESFQYLTTAGVFISDIKEGKLIECDVDKIINAQKAGLQSRKDNALQGRRGSDEWMQACHDVPGLVRERASDLLSHLERHDTKPTTIKPSFTPLSQKEISDIIILLSQLSTEAPRVDGAAVREVLRTIAPPNIQSQYIPTLERIHSFLLAHAPGI